LFVNVVGGMIRPHGESRGAMIGLALYAFVLGKVTISNTKEHTSIEVHSYFLAELS